MIFRLAFHRLIILTKQPLLLALNILVPVVLAFLGGFFFHASTMEIRVPIALVDEDQSEYSQLVIARLQQDSAVRVLVLKREQAEQLLRRNKVDSIFVFQNGFEQKLLKNEDYVIKIVKTPVSIASGLIREVVASQILRLSSNVLAANYVVAKYRELGLPAQQEVWKEAWEYTDSQWEPKPLMTIAYQEGAVDKLVTTEQPWTEPIKSLKGWLLLVLMLMAFLSSTWVIDEQKAGILRRIKSTAVQLSTYLIGNSLPFLFVWIIDIVIVFLWAIPFYGVPVEEAFKLSLLFTVYATFCWALSITFASFSKSSGQLQMVALLITLLSTLMSGAILPVPEVIPYANWVSRLTPQFWVLQPDIGKGITVLLGASIITVASVYKCLTKRLTLM